MVRDGRGGHLGRAIGHPGEDVSEEVDPAALEGRAGHDRGHAWRRPSWTPAMTSCTPPSPRAFRRPQPRVGAYFGAAVATPRVLLEQLVCAARASRTLQGLKDRYWLIASRTSRTGPRRP
jgi:hypothetical protein